MIPTKIDRVWATGLWEGEGSIYYTTVKDKRYGRTYPLRRIKLNMTNEKVVRRFHKIVGVGTVIIEDRYKKKNPKWKRQWHWSVTAFEKVQYVVCLLWLGLSRHRKDQIKNVLCR